MNRKARSSFKFSVLCKEIFSEFFRPINPEIDFPIILPTDCTCIMLTNHKFILIFFNFSFAKGEFYLKKLTFLKYEF